MFDGLPLAAFIGKYSYFFIKSRINEMFLQKVYFPILREHRA